MDIAKECILNPEKSISQIAYELGFQYPQHFTRLFKKVVGQTPNDYKIRKTKVSNNSIHTLLLADVNKTGERRLSDH